MTAARCRVPGAATLAADGCAGPGWLHAWGWLMRSGAVRRLPSIRWPVVLALLALAASGGPAWAVGVQGGQALVAARQEQASGRWPPRAEVISVAGRVIGIALPPGFVQLSPRLKGHHEALGLADGGGNEPLLVLVPAVLARSPEMPVMDGAAGPDIGNGLGAVQPVVAEQAADVAAAVPGREAVAAVPRHLVVKTPAVPRIQRMSAAEFQVFRRHVQEDHQRLLAQQPDWPEGLVALAGGARPGGPAGERDGYGSGNGVAHAVGSDDGQQASGQPRMMQAVHVEPGRWLLPIHADDEHVLAYSAVNVLGAIGGAVPLVQTQTLAMLHVGERLLFLQVNGGRDDLAWTRMLMQRWVQGIRQANPRVQGADGIGPERDGAVMAGGTPVAGMADAIDGVLARVVADAQDAVGEATGLLPALPAVPSPASERDEGTRSLASTALSKLVLGLVCALLLWVWRRLRAR